MTDKQQTRRDKPKQQESTKPEEIISLDIGEEGEESIDLDAETTLSLLEDSLEDEYADRVAHQTSDDAVRESFVERQKLDAGHRELEERLKEHHATSPELAAGDIDAAWEDAGVGEETPGGMNPTPDQDMVEEIGEALGITYREDEPLDTEGKLSERDRQRWELNPDSAEKSEER